MKKNLAHLLAFFLGMAVIPLCAGAQGPGPLNQAIRQELTNLGILDESGAPIGGEVVETGDALSGAGTEADPLVANAKVEGLADAAATDNNFLVGNGTIFVAENAATALASMGAQGLDAQLTDVAGVSATADQFLGGNGTNLVMRTAAQVRTSLALVVGTNVQAWDDDLDDLAALAKVRGDILVIDNTNSVNKFATGAVGTVLAGGTDPFWDSAPLLTTLQLGAESNLGIQLTVSGGNLVFLDGDGTALGSNDRITWGDVGICMDAHSPTLPNYSTSGDQDCGYGFLEDDAPGITSAGKWRYVISNSITLVDNTATTVFTIPLTSDNTVGGWLEYTIHAHSTGIDNYSVTKGRVNFTANDDSGTLDPDIAEEFTPLTSSVGALTLADTWTLLDGTNLVSIQVQADTSLASTTSFFVEYEVHLSHSASSFTPTMP